MDAKTEKETFERLLRAAQDVVNDAHRIDSDDDIVDSELIDALDAVVQEFHIDAVKTIAEGARRQAEVCGHHGCTLRPGHFPGHTDR